MSYPNCLRINWLTVFSSNAKLLFPTKYNETSSWRQFASANVLKGTTLVKLTGKRSSSTLSTKINLRFSHSFRI